MIGENKNEGLDLEKKVGVLILKKRLDLDESGKSSKRLILLTLKKSPDQKIRSD